MSDTYDKILKDIRARRPAPVYLLHGEEGFFSDRIVEEFEQYLPAEERAFNLFVLYAPEKEPDDVMDIARRYPLMSEKIVIVVKETQSVRGGAGKWVNKLAKYAANPSPNTVLVVSARGAKIACKEFTDALAKGGGVVLESTKLYDEKIPSTIGAFIKQAGLNYELDAVHMLADNIGNDLSKLYNEITKLKSILPPGATVTPEVIESNIGISREFNNYELTRALAYRDAKKAIRIIKYFNSNQRDNPWVMTLAAIFSLFAGTLVAFYTDRSYSAISNALGTRSKNAITDCQETMRNYSAAQIIEIIGLIRKADANCKGNGSRMETENIMENLILNILFAQGKL